MKIIYPKSNILPLLGVFIMSLCSMSVSAQVQTPGCQASAPGSLAVNQIAATSAHFTWNYNSATGGIGFGYEIRTSGDPGEDSNTANGYVTAGATDDTEVTVSGLTPNTTYTFYVRYLCDEDDGSTFSGIVFTTADIAPPVAIAATFVEDDSFLALWLPSPGAISYLLDVSTDPGFNTFVPIIVGYDELNNPIIDGYYENFPVAGTSRVVDELTPLTTYYYRVQAVRGATTTAESTTIQVTTTDVPPTEVFWTSGGWTSDPTIELPATMLANFDTALHGSFDALTLTVDPGVVVEISDSGYIQVANEVINNAGAQGLIVHTNGNLVQDNDVENIGDITVERASSELFRLDYTLWSSPTSEGTTADQTLAQFSPLTHNSRFYTLNTATNVFTSVIPFTTFDEGKGFLIRTPNNHVANENSNAPQSWLGVFKGIPTNGDVVVAISDAGSGYNAIGNPYPSALFGNIFINENDNLTGTGAITGTLYFWRRTNMPDEAPYDAQNTYYATYNLTGGTASTSSEIPNGDIKPGQGFLVQATPGGNEVFFNNDMRSSQTFNNQFFRSAGVASTVAPELEKHRIWLNLTNEGGAFSQTLVGYVENASNEVDYGFDGLFINDAGIALTSYLANAEYAIQGRALPFADSDVVPLNFKTPIAGNYTITIAQADGLFTGDSQAVYLRDNLQNVTHDLRDSAYSFATEAGSFNNRFEVVYQNSLGVNDPSLNSNSVVVYKQAGDFVINSGNQVIASVKVFDIRGRLLVEKVAVNASETSVNAGTDKQVLLVQITTTDNTVITKKVIN